MSEFTFYADLKDELADFRQWLADALELAGVSLRNQLRLWRRQELDYVVLPLGGPLPERSAPPRSFIERQLPLPDPPLSLQAIHARLRLIADAANVRGVVLVLQGVGGSLATWQSVRSAIARLQAAGKEVVVYTPYLDMPHFYIAAAADVVVTPPGAEFTALGLRSEAMFLKDSLAQLGIQVETVQISPYKTGGNMLSEAGVTPEQAEQMGWLLDDVYDQMTAAMGHGRSLDQAALLSHLDQGPFKAEEACARGLVDHVAYEDDLPALLGRRLADRKSAAPPEPPPGETAPQPDTAAATSADGSATAVPAESPAETASGNDEAAAGPEPPRARLRSWSAAREMLLEKPRRRSRRHIGVISIEGTIIMGPSDAPGPIDLPVPLVSDLSAGEETLIQLVRRAEKQSDMAALIVHLETGGGSALASDLIWRELARVARKKPVLAYMGDVTASGGYYIAAAASHIVAQPGTITGSIGVFTMRPSLSGLYDKLHVSRFQLTRGERVELFAGEEPLTEEQRALLWEGIVESYRQFKTVVANGRDLPLESLDPICEGRVWSGRQAQERSLVDTFGDFPDVVHRAAELAELPLDDANDVPVYNLYPRDKRYRLPRAFEPDKDGRAPTLAQLVTRLAAPRIERLANQELYLMPFELRFK